MSTSARARARPEPEAAPAPTSAPEPGHTAKLVRGATYHLGAKPGAWPDQIFHAGQTVQIDEATFEHLAERAVDLVTMREGGRVTAQLIRKFRLSGPDGILPKVYSETVTADGGEEVEDPYQ